MSRMGIMFLVIGGVTMLLFMGTMYLTFDATNRLFDVDSYEEKVEQNGLEAKAKILSIDDALLFGGVSLNEQRYLEVKMEIDNGIDAPYIIAIDTTIPYGTSINEGDFIPVLIDKNNKRAVVYDFARGEINQDNL